MRTPGVGVGVGTGVGVGVGVGVAVGSTDTDGVGAGVAVVGCEALHPAAKAAIMIVAPSVTMYFFIEILPFPIMSN